VPRDNDVQRAEINRKTVIDWKSDAPQATNTGNWRAPSTPIKNS